MKGGGLTLFAGGRRENMLMEAPIMGKKKRTVAARDEGQLSRC